MRFVPGLKTRLKQADRRLANTVILVLQQRQRELSVRLAKPFKCPHRVHTPDTIPGLRESF